MSTVIGFDTATDDTAVAAADGDELLFSSLTEPASDGRPRHGTQLLVEIEKAADAAGGWEAVRRIAVGVGPGSFTGLRIGVATAKALAASLGLELVAVGTLAAIARGAAGGAGKPVLAVLDARRGEVFAALHDAGGDQVWEPFVAAPAQLAERILQLPEAPLAAGSGAIRFRNELQAGGAEIPDDRDPLHRVEAAQVCALGASATAALPEDVLPIYLRRPDAERWRERDGTDN
jgi:tRNA threonylcarbamoyladenosine biosynthesis protein TsaB